MTTAPTPTEIRSPVVPWNTARRAWERGYCIDLLLRTHGNVAAAARLAVKDRKDFNQVLKRTGIDANDYRRKRHDAGHQGEHATGDPTWPA